MMGDKNLLLSPGKGKSPVGSKLQAVVPPVLKEVGKLAASVASVSTGSATGNPRNKCALQPGHSLMDWIRLGSSGKDLTGVGPLAGKMRVTPEELRKHDSEDDAWIVVRGNVYNITPYLHYHPGGVEQIMQGAGMDATNLFNEVHPWVNFDQILAKCLIGTLTSANDQDPTQSRPTRQRVNPLSAASPVEIAVSKSATSAPTFDWIQKTETINLFFYTGSANNPYLEIHPPLGNLFKLTISRFSRSFCYSPDLHNEVIWPPHFKINYDTGRIDVLFEKAKVDVWRTFGTMESKEGPELSTEEIVKYKHVSRKKITPDCFLLEFERTDGVLHNVPVGQHVRVYLPNKEMDVFKSYTGVPSCVLSGFNKEKYTTSRLYLLVKRYPNGTVSKYITNLKKGDIISGTAPFGTYDLKGSANTSYFILLAAGTGITPMLNLILYLLERRSKPCLKLVLVFFNRHDEDIIFKKDLRDLEKSDNRFKVEFVLSQPSKSWSGERGHISENMILKLTAKMLPANVAITEDIYYAACGPPGFVENTLHTLLRQLGIRKDNVYTFQG